MIGLKFSGTTVLPDSQQTGPFKMRLDCGPVTGGGSQAGTVYAEIPCQNPYHPNLPVDYTSWEIFIRADPTATPALPFHTINYRNILLTGERLGAALDAAIAGNRVALTEDQLP